MTKKINYEDEAQKLSKAIDIAIESFKKFPPEIWSKEILNQTINCYTEWKDLALNPKPEFHKISSLKYLINDTFTFFQEGSGKEVEYFWEQLDKQNLNYLRKDKLQEIFKRGNIKNRIEFEYVTDIILATEQEKRITENEANRLGIMLREFELKKKK